MLAAVVLVAVTGLVQVEALRHIWHFSRTEFAVAMTALIGVLGSGLLNGVLLGVALSIVLLIHRASRPRVIEVGRVPGTSYFADLARHPENERISDVLVVRSEGSAPLLQRRSRPRSADGAAAGPGRRAGAADLLHGQRARTWISPAPNCWPTCTPRCSQRGIEFRLAETHGTVREALRRLGSAHAAALAEAHQTVDDVLRGWRTTTRPAA